MVGVRYPFQRCRLVAPTGPKTRGLAPRPPSSFLPTGKLQFRGLGVIFLLCAIFKLNSRVAPKPKL